MSLGPNATIPRPAPVVPNSSDCEALAREEVGDTVTCESTYPLVKAKLNPPLWVNWRSL
jgi:hypothetical protein